MIVGLFNAVSFSAELWPILLPLVAGGWAIFLLLPRPSAYPLRWGTGLGVLALVLIGVLLTRSKVVSPETILFWSFSALAIVSGTLLVTQSNPARAALSFALVVLSTCGLFLLLAAPFLMAATIIIYAGAIIVTFLFVIMLAQQVGWSDADDRSREPLLSTISGFVLLAMLLFVLQRYESRIDQSAVEIEELQGKARNAAGLASKEEMNQLVRMENDKGDLFVQFESHYREKHAWKDLEDQVRSLELDWSANYEDAKDRGTAKMRSLLNDLISLGEVAKHRLGWLPPASRAQLSNLSGPPPTLEVENIRRDPGSGLPHLPAENAAYLGRSLFTDFLLPVELGGTLLLVATVGAIAIAFRRS